MLAWLLREAGFRPWPPAAGTSEIVDPLIGDTDVTPIVPWPHRLRVAVSRRTQAWATSSTVGCFERSARFRSSAGGACGGGGMEPASIRTCSRPVAAALRRRLREEPGGEPDP